MAEKEIKIKDITEADVKDVDDLESRLQELQDQKLQLQIESDTAELDEVNSQIEETQNKLDELKANPEVDDSEIQALEDELADLESRRIDLEISVNSAELDQAKDSMDELESKSQQTTSTIDGVGGALTGIAAAAGLEKMVETADNINNSWNRLSLTFAGTGVSIDQLQQKQSELSASTGQTGGTIRNFFNDMGIAGVTNTNLLGSAFESLSGKAYQTGQSVESMEGKFQKMVMSGNASSKMLVSMGITAEQLAQAMGVSADQVSEAFKNMTPEERIQALTKAMGDGKEANEMYKNSFQGLKTQAEASLAGLVGAVGQAILPTIIPMLKLATNAIKTLTDGFKKLPKPVQQIIGAFGGVALAAVSIIGVLGVVGQVVKTVKSGIQALTGIMRIWEGVTKMVEFAQAALNFVMSMNPIVLIIMAIIALIAILVYLYYTNEDVRKAIDGFIESLKGIASTIYNTLVAAFEWLQGAWQNTVDWFNSGVNTIESVFDTLYQAIQPIIDSVQWLIDKLTALANGDWTVTIEIIKAGVSSGVDTVTDIADNDLSRGIVGAIAGPEALAQVDEAMPEFKEKLSTSINDMLQSIWDDGTQGFLGWLGEISGIDTASYLQGMQTAFMGIPDYVNQAGIGVLQGFQNMLIGVSTSLNNIITVIINFGGRLVSSITTAAHNAWTSFVNNIKGMWKHMQEEVDAILGEAERLLRELPGKLWNAAVRMVQGWLTGSGEGSPGFMFYAFDEDLGAMEDRAGNNRVPDLIGGTARDMVNSWGNPELSYDVRGSGSDGSEVVGLLRELVEVMKTGRRGGDLVFNHYGDVDTEERLQRILDFIVRATEWDNNTSGRTV